MLRMTSLLKNDQILCYSSFLLINEERGNFAYVGSFYAAGFSSEINKNMHHRHIKSQVISP